MTDNPNPKSHELYWFLWSVTAAFGTYFCMYFYRKPFTAGEFQGYIWLGIDYKTVLIISQVFGYTISKFLGIKIVSEVTPRKRAGIILILIGIAELTLLLFGLTPPPYNFVWLFFNGLPLGMVFGLVLGSLEGRRQTEALTAGLCVSFVVAGGATRWTGSSLVVDAGVSEYWMPFVTGAIFAPALLLFVWMLSRVPPPSVDDVVARSERTPMTGYERWSFFRRYAFGLTLLVLIYLMVTILRSVRDDYSKEIWASISSVTNPEDLGLTEICVALAIVFSIGSAVLIRDNRKAFSFSMMICFAGPAILILTLLGWEARLISPFVFMALIGIGLYLPYIAIHTIVFERLIAMTRDRGNMTYLMYLVDSIGYLGYVVVLLVKSFSRTSENFMSFFVPLSWAIAIICALAVVPCWVYFLRHSATREVG